MSDIGKRESIYSKVVKKCAKATRLMHRVFVRLVFGDLQKHMGVTDHERFKDGYEKARKRFVRSVLGELIFGIVLAIMITFVIERFIEEDMDMHWWIRTGFICVVVASLAHAGRQFWSLPENVIFDTYKHLIESYPEISSLVHVRLLSKLESLHLQFGNLLTDAGEIWDSARRHEVACCMLAAFEPKRTYWATSTDAPFKSFESVESFYRAQEEILRDGDVKRLLVYPWGKLLTALQDPKRRDNLEGFIRLHEKNHFQLRYWPRSLQDLKNDLKLYVGEAPVLVDMAIVGDSVVFGQEAAPNDRVNVSGRGHIRTSNGFVMSYKSAFTSIWDRRRGEMMSAKQLLAFLRLLEMWSAETPMTESTSQVLHGRAYFDQVVGQIEHSSELRAIDIAQVTEAWLNQAEYIGFLEATIKSAQNHPDSHHARVYVLQDYLYDMTSVFIKKVIIPQVTAGVCVHFLFNSSLLDLNLAAVDCIFSDSWGFFLAPRQAFDFNKLSSRNNAMESRQIVFFLDMFEKLVETLHMPYVYTCKKLDDCHDPALFHFLEGSYVHRQERRIDDEL